MGGPGRYTELLAAITGVSEGEGSFSDRKSLLGCGTWRLAPATPSRYTLQCLVKQHHKHEDGTRPCNH